MGRWPELIAILRKKAAVVAEPDEKVALHLRVANLYLEKFSNQAEAIKAFEAALELDPGNEQALGYLKQMYEKRRDWDKLVALTRGEIDAHRRRRRAAPAADRGGPAGLREAEEAVDLASSCGRRCWPRRGRRRREALAELEKLYEREKAWAELGAVLERQAQQLPRGQARGRAC